MSIEGVSDPKVSGECRRKGAKIWVNGKPRSTSLKTEIAPGSRRHFDLMCRVLALTCSGFQ